MVLVAAAIKIQTRRRRRRFKIRPINRARRVTGNFKYYQRIKQLDDEQFFKYTRMTVPVFEELLGMIRHKIARAKRRDGVTTEERLVLTLQYLSQGTSMQALAWTFNLGITTVHCIIHETCRAIWDSLSSVFIKTPDTEGQWWAIATDFETKWHFNHCIGAIDGKHINIQAPAGSGSLFFNYKKQFSIVLLAACDANYLFTLVDIGAYGSQSDGGVLKNSIFGQRLEAGDMKLPRSEALPASTVEMPYFFVADEAFPLKPYIMRPFPGKNLALRERIFNYRLSRARQTIENAFGILVARWRILKTTINAKVENVDNIVKAVVVLHNYCKIRMGTNLYCPSGFVDTDINANGIWRTEQQPLQSVGHVGSNIGRRYDQRNRDLLADYFQSSAGSVAWKETTVLRGRQLL